MVEGISLLLSRLIKSMDKKKELLIVASESYKPENIRVDGVDVLAMTLPVMVNMRNAGIKFLTFDDFLSRKKLQSEAVEFSGVFDLVMSEIDDLFEYYDIERAMRSNAFWILMRFSSLRYVTLMIGLLEDEYCKIKLIVPYDLAELPKPCVSWSSLNWSTFGFGLHAYLTHFFYGFENATFEVVSPNSVRFTLHRYKSLFTRIPNILQRRGASFLKKIFRKRIGLMSGSTVWVVQGGYDVDVVQEKMGNKYVFKTVIEAERSRAINCDEILCFDEVRDDLEAILDMFCSEFFPYHSEWVKEWMYSYFENVISNYKAVVEGVRVRLEKDNPVAVLYSIGSEDVLEEIIAKSAIELGVPVFYFKHSSIDNLFVSPSIYDPYFERDCYIKRTQFISSDIERGLYDKKDLIRFVVSGPLSRPKGDEIKFSGKRVLYSVGSPNHYSYREMWRTVTDFERYCFSRDLLYLTDKLGLSVDIKIHPTESDISYEYFTRIIEAEGYQKARLIPEGTVERIVKNYSVIVLDMMSTRVLSSVLTLRIPIILFVPPDFPVEKERFNDLKERVYIVHTLNDLEVILCRLASSGLGERNIDFFKDKYFGSTSASQSLEIARNEIFVN